MQLHDKLEHLTWIENVAYQCIYAEQYFEMTTDHDGQFWPVVQRSLGEAVCILWSHVFGNRKDDLHYSKFFAGDDMSILSKAFDSDVIITRILAKIRNEQHRVRNLPERSKSM